MIDQCAFNARVWYYCSATTVVVSSFNFFQAIPLLNREAKWFNSMATLSSCPSAVAVVFDVIFQLIIKPFSASESASGESGGLTQCGVPSSLAPVGCVCIMACDGRLASFQGAAQSLPSLRCHFSPHKSNLDLDLHVGVGSGIKSGLL